ncbi:MAG: polysaccharide deacetylase family protein [Thiohalospira sp.]
MPQKSKKRIVFFTNDVETTSLWNHRLSDKTGEKVLKEGMPVLLELYKKYNIRSTFFFTGYIAQKFPEIVKMILPYGHEVGCHGMFHDPNLAFDVLSLHEQKKHLTQAKDILEDISGQKIISFRAPALRVNKFTPAALIENGFLMDSSVASQRMDFFLSFGAKDKLKWVFAPRKPFFTEENNLARKGKGPLLEIPATALFLPYAGTFTRISPFFTRWVRELLHFENKITHTPVHYIIHPNELITEEIEIKKVKRRAKSFMGYILGDLVRYKLKLKNLGPPAIQLFEKQLIYFNKRNYKGISLQDYYKNILDYEATGKKS